MLFKLHLIPSVFMQIRCNFPDISYLSETQKNTFQFLTQYKGTELGVLKVLN